MLYLHRQDDQGIIGAPEMAPNPGLAFGLVSLHCCPKPELSLCTCRALELRAPEHPVPQPHTDLMWASTERGWKKPFKEQDKPLLAHAELAS